MLLVVKVVPHAEVDARGHQQCVKCCETTLHFDCPVLHESFSGLLRVRNDFVKLIPLQEHHCVDQTAEITRHEISQVHHGYKVLIEKWRLPKEESPYDRSPRPH